jgi:azobenzene reductase
MQVALVIGSVRKERQSHKVAHYLEKVLKQRGIMTDLIDLLKYPLPIYGLPTEQPDELENIKWMSDRLMDADAMILVTPEYHGTFSGALKNTLDHFWVEFQKKPIGVAAASVGMFGGLNASTQLQHVILSLGAYPLPLKLLIPQIQLAFDDLFEANSDDIIKSTRRFVDEFLWLADAVYRKKLQKTIINRT